MSIWASEVLRAGCTCKKCGRPLETGEKIVKYRAFNASGMVCSICITKTWHDIDTRKELKNENKTRIKRSKV